MKKEQQPFDAVRAAAEHAFGYGWKQYAESQVKGQETGDRAWLELAQSWFNWLTGKYQPPQDQ